jgi:hypothetical protein
MRPHDTSQAAHEFQIRGYRRMDAGQKAELVAGLSEAVRDVALKGTASGTRAMGTTTSRGLSSYCSTPIHQ